MEKSKIIRYIGRSRKIIKWTIKKNIEINKLDINMIFDKNIMT